MKYLLWNVFLVAGILIGLFIGKFPFITIKNEVGVGELGTLVTSLVLAVVMPYLFSSWINDKRHLKDFLMREVNECLGCIEEIKKKLLDCHACGKISPKDKRRINVLFHSADLKVHSLVEQLELSFNKESRNSTKLLGEEYTDYWKFVTGGDLMSEKFKVVDEDFCRTHNKEYARVELALKKIVHNINSF